MCATRNRSNSILYISCVREGSAGCGAGGEFRIESGECSGECSCERAVNSAANRARHEVAKRSSGGRSRDSNRAGYAAERAGARYIRERECVVAKQFSTSAHGSVCAFHP